MKQSLQRLQRSWNVSPALFRRISYATLIFCAVIIVTGGVVRLTQSGLGCPTWPDCTTGHFTASFNYHPMVEFVNRVVTFFAALGMSVTAIFAFFRKPFRRDIMWLSVGLFVEVVAESVLGGITVLEKLAPPFVMAHFVLAIIVLWNSLVLYKHAISAAGKVQPVVGKEIVWLGRLMFLNLGAVIIVGTAVAGTGPYSGSPISSRLPFNLRQVAYLHADFAIVLVALILANLFLLHQARAPEVVQRRARMLLWMGAIQAVIGYTTYFSGLPAILIGIHIAGATLTWIAMTWYYLSLFHVSREARSEVGAKASQATSLPGPSYAS
ncbi:MAG: COX15/CtaA family protein [Ferrimicrobium sp.]|jgi:cytochrome c oxidase assembly protein subunit 15|uniref:COX15/CtaA family protein n=1 Tax=Ferrimicrobium acidiphilum TaxID=121039 RepID=A0ABV3Y4K6_9ACTN|nr:COX15/CtaA family protein [Ferrimicrobium sp.]